MASSTTTASLAAAAAAAVLPELPEAAVAAILQHVPQHQRLTSCALVCRAWAAGATAATTDVDVQFSHSGQRQQLHDWLGKHGGVVQRLSIQHTDRFGHYMDPYTLKLPIGKLVQLRKLHVANLVFYVALQGGNTNSTSSSSSSSSSSSRGRQGPSGMSESAAALLPQLQELTLSSCCLTLASATQLLSAMALSKLHWQRVVVYHDPWERLVPDNQLVPTLWQQLQRLPNLSELTLQHYAGRFATTDMTPVSNLHRLRALDTCVSPQVDLPTLAALVPAGLTALRVSAQHTVDEDATDMPAAGCITRLSSLAILHRICDRMLPSCMSSLTGLQELCCHYPRYVNLASGPRELLAALQHLTQLRDLQLRGCEFDWSEGWRQQHQQQQEGGQNRYQCFSALTASPQLTALVVVSCDDTMPVPLGTPTAVGAVDHMFPTGRVLPKLQVLTLESWRPEGAYDRDRHCVEPAHIARIAASCPALQELALWYVTPEDFDCSCLLQLPPGVTKVEDLGWLRPAVQVADEAGSHELLNIQPATMAAAEPSGAGVPPQPTV